MKFQLSNNSFYQVIILDISGVYAQIHDQKHCNEAELAQVKEHYSDTEHWRIVVVDFS